MHDKMALSSLGFIFCPLLIMSAFLTAGDVATVPLRQLGYGGVTCSALSPDGTRFITGTTDTKTYLFDLNSGVLIQSFSGHTQEITAACYSPDGSKILTSSADGTVIIFTTTTGKILHTLSGHTDRVNAIAISTDGSTAISGADDSTAILWNMNTGAMMRTFSGHRGEILAVCLSPDGSLALTGSSDSSALLWDAATGGIIKSFKNGSRVPSVGYSPDGATVATGSAIGDSLARLWDVATGALIRTFQGNPWGASIVLFSPDGSKLLYSSQGGEYNLFDVNSGAVVYSLQDRSHMLSASFSPDGSMILGGFYDNRVCLINYAENSMVREYVGYMFWVGSVKFSNDGSQLLTTGYGWGSSNMALWSVDSGTLIRSFPSTGSFSGAVFSPDGAKILTAEYRACQYDVNTGARLRTFGNQIKSVTSSCYSPDGSRVLTGSLDSTAKLYDANTGSLIRTFPEHGAEIQSVAFLPDGSKVITGGSCHPVEGCTVKLWDVNSGELVRTYSGHTGAVNAIVCFPDGTKMLTGGSSDRTAILRDVATGTVLHTYSSPGPWIDCIALSPDCTKMVTAGFWKTTAHLWDLESGEVLRTFDGQSDFVFSAAYSPDGSKIALGTRNGNALLWDVASFNASVKQLGGPRERSIDLSVREKRGHLYITVPEGVSVNNGWLDLYSTAGRCIQRYGGNGAAHQSTADYALPRSLGKGVYLYRFFNGKTACTGSFILVK